MKAYLLSLLKMKAGRDEQAVYLHDNCGIFRIDSRSRFIATQILLKAGYLNNPESINRN